MHTSCIGWANVKADLFRSRLHLINLDSVIWHAIASTRQAAKLLQQHLTRRRRREPIERARSEKNTHTRTPLCPMEYIGFGLGIWEKENETRADEIRYEKKCDKMN